MEKYLRMGLVLILALAIVLFSTVIGDKLTDPAAYDHTIEMLDRSRSTVLGLSAASAAASAAVSALPGDLCTPLSQEISQFTTWFLLILSVVYLEKYLLTIFGFAACYLLIPVGCSALLINCFFPRGFLQTIGMKLLALGAAMLLVIPTSVWVSDQINAVYADSIAVTVESADAISHALLEEIPDENQENTSVIDEAAAMLTDMSGTVAEIVEQFKHMLNRFVEATAVMLVTTCLIPVLVILFFLWIVRTLFHVQILLPASHPVSGKKRRSQSREEARDI